MNVQPLSDRILLKRIKVENISKGGIILDNAPEHHSKYARVVAVGKNVTEVKPGDKVLIPGWNRCDLKIDGEEHICMTELEIIGVVAEDE